MKTFKFLTLLVLLIIIFQPQIGHACVMQMFSEDSWTDCPAGSKEALSEIGLEPSIPLKCREKLYDKFKDENLSFINIYYERSKHCNTLVSRTFLHSKDGELQYAPLRPAFNSPVRSYAADQLKAPLWGSWSNMGLSNFSTHEIKKLETGYCFLFHLKFPYKGTIYQCPSEVDKKEYTVSGEIDYVEGAFRWVDGYRPILKECPKYFNSMCNPPTMGEGRDKFYKYFGGAHANTVIKLNEDKSEVEYYLIGMPFYINQNTQYEDKPLSGHNEGVILVKVTSDGKLQSKEIERKSYKAEELFELGNKMFKD